MQGVQEGIAGRECMQGMQAGSACRKCRQEMHAGNAGRKCRQGMQAGSACRECRQEMQAGNAGRGVGVELRRHQCVCVCMRACVCARACACVRERAVCVCVTGKFLMLCAISEESGMLRVKTRWHSSHPKCSGINVSHNVASTPPPLRPPSTSSVG